MAKIFQLISSIQLGGAENVAFHLAEHCGKGYLNSFEFIVVELYRTRNEYANSKKEELISKNIRVITLYNGSKRNSLLFAPFTLINLIRKEKPQIIHSHTDLPDFVLAVATYFARLMQIKMPRVLRTIHSTQLWRNHVWMGKIAESAYHDESVAAVSLFALNAYEQLRNKYNLPISSNRQIVYNGCRVPTKRLHSFPIDKQKINIAFCGRFEDYKGMETLIPAIEDIENRFPGRFNFFIVGDGTYKKQLEKLSQKYQNVFLYNPIPNISELFHAFDYIFMPSHFEGLALISIESSLSGVPVIASYAPGLDETLPDNWPLKFHLQNREELYDIFEKINSNSYDIEGLRKIAYDFAVNNFSLQRMINSYTILYNRMI